MTSIIKDTSDTAVKTLVKFTPETALNAENLNQPLQALVNLTPEPGAASSGGITEFYDSGLVRGNPTRTRRDGRTMYEQSFEHNITDPRGFNLYIVPRINNNNDVGIVKGSYYSLTDSPHTADVQRTYNYFYFNELNATSGKPTIVFLSHYNNIRLHRPIKSSTISRGSHYVAMLWADFDFHLYVWK